MDAILGLLTDTQWRIALYLLGVLARTLWPYYLQWRDTKNPFDLNYVIGEWIGALIGLMGVLAAPAFLLDLGLLSFFGAFVAGYGATQIGRDGQKTWLAIRSR